MSKKVERGRIGQARCSPYQFRSPIDLTNYFASHPAADQRTIGPRVHPSRK
jgi:hypothetical protein